MKEKKKQIRRVGLTPEDIQTLRNVVNNCTNDNLRALEKLLNYKIDVKSRRCSVCKMDKPISEYYYSDHGRACTISWCIDCTKARTKEKAKKQNLLEYRRLYQRLYYRENREKVLEYQKKYRAKNREKVAKYQKEYAARKKGKTLPGK